MIDIPLPVAIVLAAFALLMIVVSIPGAVAELRQSSKDKAAKREAVPPLQRFLETKVSVTPFGQEDKHIAELIAPTTGPVPLPNEHVPSEPVREFGVTARL